LKDNSCQSLIDFRLNRINEYLLEKIMDQRERGKILAELGTVHSLLGEPRKAIEFTKAAYDTFEQIESLYAEQARKKLAEWQGDDSHK
jgi:hypothetical protein